MELQGVYDQLTQVQSQLTQAMNTQAFSAEPIQAAPVSPASFGFTDTMPNFSQGIAAQTNNAFAMMNETFNSVGSQIQDLSKTMQLGAYKMNEMARLEQIAAPMGAMFLPNTNIDTAAKPSFSTMGMYQSFFSQFGVGWDPNDSAMTRAEYMEKAKNRFGSDEINSEVMGGILGVGAGLAATAAIGLTMTGPLGWAVGIGAGFVAEEVTGGAYGFLRRGDIERERLGNYAREGSFRFAGGSFSRAEGAYIGSEIQGMFNSKEFFKRDMSQGQAEGIIAEYTEGGGFDSVQSAEQYVNKVSQLVENSQRVAQLLHTNLKTAAATMAQMEQAGIVDSPADALAMIYKLEARAGMAGLSTGEMLNLGFAGASMVQGTGIGFNTGATGIADIASSIGQSMHAGTMSSSALLHLGGTEKASQLLMQQALGMGTGSIGIALNAAGGGLQYDIMGALGRGASNINSREDILQLMGSQTQFVDEMGVAGLSVQNLANAAYAQDLMQLKINTPEQMAAFLVQAKAAPNMEAAKVMMGSAESLSPFAVASAEISKQNADNTSQTSGAFYELKQAWKTAMYYGSKAMDFVSLNRGIDGFSKSYSIDASDLDFDVSAADKEDYQKFLASPGTWKETFNYVMFGTTIKKDEEDYLRESDISFGEEAKKVAAKAGYSNYLDLLVDLERVPEEERDKFLRGKGLSTRKERNEATLGLFNPKLQQAVRHHRASRQYEAMENVIGTLTKDFEGAPSAANVDDPKLKALSKEIDDIRNLSPYSSTDELLTEFNDITAAGRRTGKSPMELSEEGYSMFNNHVMLKRLLTGQDRDPQTFLRSLAAGRSGDDSTVGSASSYEGTDQLLNLLSDSRVRNFLEQLQGLAITMQDINRTRR